MGEAFSLEYLDNLSFNDTGFDYNGLSYTYAAIQHVEYYSVATKHSVNLIPTGTDYQTTLLLHLNAGTRLQIKQQRRWLGRGDRQRSEAVMKAASLFMHLTFAQRLDLYESQMAERGYVAWASYQFSKNGDLFKNNELMVNIRSNVADARLGVFEISFSSKVNSGELAGRLKRAFGGGVEKVDLRLDRDCFLFIMKEHYGLVWAGHPAPERPRSGKYLFNDALLILGAKVCKADGRITHEEVALFKQYFGIDDSSHPGASETLRSAAESPEGVAEAAKRIRRGIGDNRAALEYVIIGLLQIASADGEMTAAEVSLISSISTGLGFTYSDMTRLFFIFEQSSASGQSRTRDRPRGGDLRVKHLLVLGLTDPTTIDAIKMAYRDLARRHHPDLLRAAGVHVENVRKAEEVLKAINASYEWLTRTFTSAN